MAEKPLAPEKGQATRQPELKRPRTKPEVERPDTDPKNSHEGATEEQVEPTTPPAGSAFEDEPRQG